MTDTRRKLAMIAVPSYKKSKPSRMKVITYQAPNGKTIDISRAQERKLTAAGKWPRNESGEYCSVSYGLHRGRPTYEEMDELLALCL